MMARSPYSELEERMGKVGSIIEKNIDAAEERLAVRLGPRERMVARYAALTYAIDVIKPIRVVCIKNDGTGP